MERVELDELIEAVALRDNASFSRLYAKMFPRIKGIAFSVLRDRDDAEEAAQEIFIKIWKQAGSFNRASGTGDQWIGAIARNHSIDAMRMRKPATDSIEDQFDLASPSPNPEENSIASSNRAAVGRSLNALAPDKASAVTQAYVNGFSCQQLAEIYEVPVNTMKTWLRRSLLTLRSSLA